MNIRIQNDQAGAASSATGRTDQISRSDGSGSKAIAARGRAGEDQVDVSSLTAGVTAANSAEAASRATRVQQLSLLVASGRYTADTASVSRSIVSSAIGRTV